MQASNGQVAAGWGRIILGGSQTWWLRLTWLGIAVVALLMCAAISLRITRTSDFIDFGMYYQTALAAREGDRLYAMATQWHEREWAIDHPAESVLGNPRCRR